MNTAAAFPKTISLPWVLILPFSAVFANWKRSIKILMILGFLPMVFLFLFLAFQINRETAEHYQVFKYESDLGNISKENQNLEMELAKANMQNNSYSLSQQLNFEKVNKVIYIKIENSQVVKK